MPHLHTCPHGHQWEAADETRPAPEGDPSLCPECGARESGVAAETIPSSEATLPAPRPHAPPPAAVGPLRANPGGARMARWGSGDIVRCVRADAVAARPRD